MATKKSAKKSAKKAAKKTAKKAIKKSTKKAAKKAAKKRTGTATRSLEALQTSAFDPEASSRYEDSDIYSPSLRDDNISSISSVSDGQDGDSSRLRMIGIAAVVVVLIVGLYLVKGQCGKDKEPVQPTIQESPVSEPAASEPEAPANDAQAEPEAQPEAEPEQAQPVSSETSYTIAPNDSLYGISRKTGVPAAEIQKANPGVSDWSRIRPGQVIQIPAR